MKQNLLKTWLVMLCMLVGIGSAWGEEVVYKTALFGSSYNSNKVSSYTGTFSATNNKFTVDLANFNNNNNGWDYVKTGNKTNASVGTITTNAAIDKAVTKVIVTIDAVTAASVNNITLYSGTSASACTTSEGTFSASTGAQTVTISSPAVNKFYKISFDCKKGSSNGLVTVSKVEYYIAGEGGTTPETPTVTAPKLDVAAGTYTEDQLVLINNYNKDYLYAYTLDGTNPAFDENLAVTNGTEYDNNEGIEITSSCTLKVIAVDEDGNASSITSATYVINKPLPPFVPTPVAEGYETVDFTTIEPYKSLNTNGSATVEDYEGTSFAMSFAKPQSSTTPTKFYQNGNAVRAYTGNTITITGAEDITAIDIAWVKGYVDDAVSITGIGTTTAVITFSKTCRFTAITVDYRKEATVTVNACGNASFSCGKALDFTNADVKAYMVTGETESSVTLTEIQKVPANTGVFVIGDGGSYNIPVLDGDADDTSANKLIATTEPKAVTASDNIWALSKTDGMLHHVSSGTIGAGKAYFVSTISGSSSAKSIVFNDEITGISNVAVKQNMDNNVYNLAGQRVNANTKGFIIVNGKKFINK